MGDRISGKVCVVAGGASGIGLGIVDVAVANAGAGGFAMLTGPRSRGP